MRVYIETYGCQMNEYDSKMIGTILEGAGHDVVDDLAGADAAIINTCSVRERAERRVLGRARHLKGLMKRDALLGIVGCFAQRIGGELAREVPGVDFIVGTDGYAGLPRVLENAGSGARTIDVVETPTESYDDRPLPKRARLCEFVSVMRGCDNHCAYCVVPRVRGPERSRSASSIVEEVTRLAVLGARDVTLVGQNVNSYRDGETGFPDLLKAVNDVPELARIRFATSHPKDLTDELIDAVGALETVCEHVHLPVQSGSDSVLAAMNRRYARAHYVDLVRRLRERVRGVALTTDVIVGFPGETEDDFRATLSLMEETRFDSAFMFRYSVREGTPAAELEDDVPEGVKIERLSEVIALQRRVTEEINSGLAGRTCEVLVEGPSKKDASLLFGRTRGGKATVFPGGEELIGGLVDVVVRSASAWTLHGEEAAGERGGSDGV